VTQLAQLQLARAACDTLVLGCHTPNFIFGYLPYYSPLYRIYDGRGLEGLGAVMCWRLGGD
jgi:hypothetical protein